MRLCGRTTTRSATSPRRSLPATMAACADPSSKPRGTSRLARSSAGQSMPARDPTTTLGFSPVRHRHGYTARVLVVFAADITIEQAWRIRRDVVSTLARFNSHLNGLKLSLAEELFERAARGEVVLAGYMVGGPGGDPTHGCLECGVEAADNDKGESDGGLCTRVQQAYWLRTQHGQPVASGEALRAYGSDHARDRAGVRLAGCRTGRCRG